MSLTEGSGPFGAEAAGSFNSDPQPPEHVLDVERSPRRVRVVLARETVADSHEVVLPHLPGATPMYLFPPQHVRTQMLEGSGRRQSDPGLGERTFWSLRVGDRRAVDAAYSWQRPPDSASSVAGLVAFDRDFVDGVFEEDEDVFVHPSDRDFTRPRMPLESGLPGRWYLVREHVCTDLLEASYTTTRCPYKGVAHWSLRLDGGFEKDVAWTYPEPSHDAEVLRGLLCFVYDRLDVGVSEAVRR